MNARIDSDNLIDTDRSATITLNGTEYELLLSTRATKEISKRYGGLDKLGDLFENAKSFEDIIGEIVWLIALLANQPIQIHNLWHENDKKPMLTEEMVELLTTPSDLTEYQGAIMTAMTRGMKRNVVSEDTEKNVTAE